ncbi:MAG: hypothetical protein LIO63_06945, partial [Akkermansia sp.]|nr:hypothetical protein [Akkermansia sp.]
MDGRALAAALEALPVRADPRVPQRVQQLPRDGAVARGDQNPVGQDVHEYSFPRRAVAEAESVRARRQAGAHAVEETLQQIGHAAIVRRPRRNGKRHLAVHAEPLRRKCARSRPARA